MTAIQTQLAPITSLEHILPKLLNDLSLARAQIAIDQIRATITSKSIDKIVYATASPADSPETPVAAAIGIQQSSADSGNASDVATLVHAGWVAESTAAENRQTMLALAAELDRELVTRGVRFLQWATDVGEAADDSVSRWCQAFGFEQIGTLDYLGGDVPGADNAAMQVGDRHALRFVPVDWDQPDAMERFAGLIDATYVETLDCPRIADYRTAAETLRGYRASSSFDANLWYCVRAGDEPVGCMVLGNHQPPPATADDPAPASAVIEIVYMGLIPKARGDGLGIHFVQQAFETGRDIGADRIILAVDQNNRPARAIYDLAGLRPMLSETVWVKSLDPENLDAT